MFIWIHDISRWVCANHLSGQNEMSKGQDVKNPVGQDFVISQRKNSMNLEVVQKDKLTCPLILLNS